MIRTFRKLIWSPVGLAGLLALAPNAFAQSTDQSLPTPVLSNEITGKINALDIGDPRLTRHFYAFEGNPGDLLVTIDSRNLNGDIDVFTAITFRPLMKTTVYASSQAPEITKGIYLRTHQILILRIEARTPGDEPGTYHIRFGGTFGQFTGGIPVAENTTSEPEAAPEKSSPNRLTSVGANIPRPPAEPETAEAKPSPSPETTVEKSSETEVAKKPATNPRRTNSRPPRRTTRPAPSKPTTATKTEGDTTRTEAETAKPAEEKPAVSEKTPETTPPTEKPKSQETVMGARLIIEEKDGTKIERPMSTVRRVIVEGNAIVIVLKTGKLERISMSDVTRMAIEPQ